jgi:hypothetical protein
MPKKQTKITTAASQNSNLFWSILILVSICLVVFSYSYVDLNLTLSGNPHYLWVQKVLTKFGYYNRPLATGIYLVLLSLLFGVYLVALKKPKLVFAKKFHWKPIFLLTLILTLGYPAFSHDIFNYLFNTKMIWVYGANPHVRTALEFAADPWVRFMHNIHTPAPYAYGWTVVSLLPGLMTLTQKFLPSLFVMKAFVAFSYLLTLRVIQLINTKLYPGQNWRVLLFALSPLVLIEILVMGHNDLWMMAPALWAWYLVLIKPKPKFLLAGLGMVLSIAMKYATVVLLPLFWLSHRLETAKKLFPEIAAILLAVVPLVRPDQLHSWYFIWSFSFAIFARSPKFISLWVALSLGALLRYAPYLYTGSWDEIYLLRNLIWVVSGMAVWPVLRLGEGRKYQ